MSIYDEMQTVASDLLREFNQPTIQLITLTPGDGPIYDPGPSVETVITLDGAVCRGVKTKYIMDGLASAGDEQVTMSGKYSPKLGDFIAVKGVRSKVVQLISKPSSGTPVVHTCIIRR